MHTTGNALLAGGSAERAHLHLPALGTKKKGTKILTLFMIQKGKEGKGDRQEEGRFNEDAPSLCPADARPPVTGRQRPPALRSFTTLMRSRSHIGTTPLPGSPIGESHPP